MIPSWYHPYPEIYMYLRREMQQLLMDLNYNLVFTVGVNSGSVQLECIHFCLYLSKIHSNTEIRDWNLCPSKVVTFLYIDTFLCYILYVVHQSTSFSKNFIFSLLHIKHKKKLFWLLIQQKLIIIYPSTKSTLHMYTVVLQNRCILLYFGPGANKWKDLVSNMQ